MIKSILCGVVASALSIGAVSLGSEASSNFASSSSASNFSPSSDGFLSSWQGSLLPVIGGLSLLDLSLPGTHDTLTYDLSTIISDGAWDGHDDISILLHAIFELIPIKPDDNALSIWIREQAQTQTLSVTQQLDAGIRFLDFRNMYSSVNLTKFDWYGLHFLQTNNVALQYLREIRTWMDNHPTEVIVLWISKHGDTTCTGQDQYPNVTVVEKKTYWQNILNVLQPLVIDTELHPINSTPLTTLLQANQRILLLTSDYEELTSHSYFALDAASHLDNELRSLHNLTVDVQNFINFFQQDLDDIMKKNKAAEKFTLLSMAGSPPSKQGIESFFLRFAALTPKYDRAACASSFGIPALTDFCPLTLMDVGHIDNYYMQHVFEAALKATAMPNAIYIDGVSVDGTLQTGEEVDQLYAYADTIILINLNRACNSQGAPASACNNLTQQVNTRRDAHPFSVWDDDHGHRSNWPTISM